MGWTIKNSLEFLTKKRHIFLAQIFIVTKSFFSPLSIQLFQNYLALFISCCHNWSWCGRNNSWYGSLYTAIFDTYDNLCNLSDQMALYLYFCRFFNGTKYLIKEDSLSSIKVVQKWRFGLLLKFWHVKNSNFFVCYCCILANGFKISADLHSFFIRTIQ